MAPGNCWPSPARGESQAAWEAFLCGIYTSADWSAASSRWCSVIAVRVWPRPIETIYPRARHQRCWVHKMRNLRDGVRRRDQAAIKRDAQRIYLARHTAEARRAFQRFRFHWQSQYPGLVRRLERDLPELLTFFDFPQPLWMLAAPSGSIAPTMIWGSAVKFLCAGRPRRSIKRMSSEECALTSS